MVKWWRMSVDSHLGAMDAVSTEGMRKGLSQGAGPGASLAPSPPPTDASSALSPADFTEPEISWVVEEAAPRGVTFTCASHGGSPRPQLLWWVNDALRRGSNTSVSQDARSGLYSVTGRLWDNGTDPLRLVCLVRFGASQVSRNLTWSPAGFSEPEISWVVEEAAPRGVTFTCASHGGSPRPQLLWWVNDAPRQGSNTSVSQDARSGLYSVTGRLWDNGTDPLRLACLVRFGASQVSRNLTWSPNPPGPKRSHAVVLLLSGTVVFICVVAAVLSARYMLSCARKRTTPVPNSTHLELLEAAHESRTGATAGSG
ncbi:tyrosine-protein phosphatase non-receptor type substrate 1-like [Tachyglossus aculeatus]|uniref:tyrosine-protein phosphatase non-receptor type substrate 1-like n=1 Tax=Tachyglossus aculeatus TaxID=9261 RepID=UPI0018F3A369|nr:tyrosine-protein phosphatase non-receptor type substrate 1-like [Tachyglossus aculeatus]